MQTLHRKSRDDTLHPGIGMKRRTRLVDFSVIWLILAGLSLVVLWEGLVFTFDVPRWKLPAPSDIGVELLDSRSLLLSHTWVTLQEILIGFSVALSTGVLLAVLISYYKAVGRLVYPIVIASQTIPIIVIAPLLLIWVGYGLTPKIIIVTLIAFFPIVVNTVDGLRSVDPEMINLMRTLGASRWQIFTKVQIPSSLPFLFSGTKVGATLSVIGAVIGEWVGSNAGLGYLTRISVPLFLTSRSFAAVLILSLLGIGIFLLVALLERMLLPWRHRSTNTNLDTQR